MSAPPLVAVIVLNWNNWPVTAECLESLQRISYPNARLLLVDNGSSDDSERILREKFPGVEIVQTGANLGYAGGNNAGMRRALALGADYLCILNNDVVVEPGFLEPLVAAMEADPRLGIAGGLQCAYDEPSRILNSGSFFSWYTGTVREPYAGQTDNGQCGRIQDVDFICGAALLARAQAARAIGLLDEAFFLLGEDADWCFRARQAGWRVCYIPGSKILHKERATRRSQPAMVSYYGLRNRIWLVRRYASPWQLAVFVLLFLTYLFPKMLVGRLLKREAPLFARLLEAFFHGFGRMPPASPVTPGGR